MRGLFAGVSLEGTTLPSDGGANESLYGKELKAAQIMVEGAASAPDAAKPPISLLIKSRLKTGHREVTKGL